MEESSLRTLFFFLKMKGERKMRSLSDVVQKLNNILFYRKEDLIKLALFDSLTKVFNRNAFELIRAEISLIALDQDLYITIVDVNNLKLINDGEGHEAGDRTLRYVADKLKELSEWVFRLSGDEFLLITESPIFSVELSSSHLANVASCGTASMNKEVTISEAMRYADIAMYENKRKRRYFACSQK
jgi:predicted signal transduction protein with EAL and GGDEF domain